MKDFALSPNIRVRITHSEQNRGRVMADSTSSSSSNALDFKALLIKEVKCHEVAIAELNSLSSSRAIYQKNANIFFRTTNQKATASEQKHLDLAKRKLEMLNIS